MLNSKLTAVHRVFTAEALLKHFTCKEVLLCNTAGRQQVVRSSENKDYRMSSIVTSLSVIWNSYCCNCCGFSNEIL
eukprot:gene2610-13441_t